MTSAAHDHEPGTEPLAQTKNLLDGLPHPEVGFGNVASGLLYLADLLVQQLMGLLLKFAHRLHRKREPLPRHTWIRVRRRKADRGPGVDDVKLRVGPVSHLERGPS